LGDLGSHIPNFITCLNLFSGSMAVYYAFQGNYPAVLLLVIIAAVFDFFDGFAARLLKAYSPMGKEMDSLADVISFGLAPGVVAFSLLSQSTLPHWIAFAGFIIPVFRHCAWQSLISTSAKLLHLSVCQRLPMPFFGLDWVILFPDF